MFLFSVIISESDTRLPFATKIGLGVGIPLAIFVLGSVVVFLLILVVKLHKSKARLEKGIKRYVIFL